MIGETDFTSALSTLHPKAIYMVEGKIYQVEELDFVGRKAHVREVDCDYYTTAITYTKVTILDRFAEDAPKVALHGEVHVVSRVVGFKKIRFQTNENVGSGELDLPEQQMHTTAYWLEVPLSIINALPYATDDRRDGVIGLAFAMKQVAQLLLMCDARDIGLSVNAGETDGDDTPRIFLYDAYPGGIGFSAPLWGMQPELLSKTSALIAGCDCDNGCPMCVGPIGETGPLAKTVALRILEHLLARAGTQAVAASARKKCRSSHGDARSTSRDRQDITGPRRCRSVAPKLVRRARASALAAKADVAASAATTSSALRSTLGGAVVEHSDGAVIVVDREYRADMLHGRTPIGEIVSTITEGDDAHAADGEGVAVARKRHRRPPAVPRSRDDRAVRRRRHAGISGRLRGDRRHLDPRPAVPAAGLRARARAAERAAGVGEDRTARSAPTTAARFDVPLIETRFMFHRVPCPLDGVPHLDMLHPARRMWRQRPLDDRHARSG